MYIGEWKKNIIHGYGIYTFEDGRIYYGEWKKNRIHGYGECYYKDGKKYFGFHKSDKKDGFGIFCWPDNKYYIGFWKEGKQNGIGKFIKGNHSKFGIWKKGKKEKWIDNENQLISYLDPYIEKYLNFFKWDDNKINDFFEIDKKYN